MHLSIMKRFPSCAVAVTALPTANPTHAAVFFIRYQGATGASSIVGISAGQ